MDPYKKHIELREEFIWTTRDGIEWFLKDMETSHIKNVINHINKNSERYNEIYEIYKNDRYNVELLIGIFSDELLYRRKIKFDEIFNK